MTPADRARWVRRAASLVRLVSPAVADAMVDGARRGEARAACLDELRRAAALRDLAVLATIGAIPSVVEERRAVLRWGRAPVGQA